MKKHKYSIPLSDENKTLITQAIEDANESDVQHFKMDYDLASDNCIPQMKLDFIKTNLRDAFIKDSSVQIVEYRIGGFSPAIIYDKKTNYLYSITSENNFIRQRKRKNNTHYICAFASKNEEKKSKDFSEQICLFDFNPEILDDKIKSKLLDIQQKTYGPIKQYVLITYKVGKLGLTSVTAYVPTVKLDIVYEENWNEYITPRFEIIPTTVIDYTSREDVEEIEISIKEEFLVNKNRDENIIKLRKDSKIDEKGDK